MPVLTAIPKELFRATEATTGGMIETVIARPANAETVSLAG